MRDSREIIQLLDTEQEWCIIGRAISFVLGIAGLIIGMVLNLVWCLGAGLISFALTYLFHKRVETLERHR